MKDTQHTILNAACMARYLWGKFAVFVDFELYSKIKTLKFVFNIIIICERACTLKINCEKSERDNPWNFYPSKLSSFTAWLCIVALHIVMIIYTYTL